MPQKGGGDVKEVGEGWGAWKTAAPKPLDINKRKVFTIWCKYLIYNLREILQADGRE